MTTTPLSSNGGTLYVHVVSTVAGFLIEPADTITVTVGSTPYNPVSRSTTMLTVAASAYSPGYYDIIVSIKKSNGVTYGGADYGGLRVAEWGYSDVDCEVYLNAGNGDGVGSSTINTITALTQAEYDALGSYDSATLYIING